MESYDRISSLTKDDSSYPPLLKEIAFPPERLYCRGALEMFRAKIGTPPLAIAVVGTRRPTRYGLETTETLVRNLVDAGVPIVSGLATGIDTAVHRAALDAGGTTIAVLGSGVDDASLFPPENRGLARRIAESGGAVLSEHPPGTHATKAYFPQRNRIIAGLTQGTVVVEAREKSGALITARLALDANREVFAVPGPAFSPTSYGPHALIKQGAKLVTSAQDILEEFGGASYAQERNARALENLSTEETALLALLDEPSTIRELKVNTHFETSTIIATLSLLELKGFVRTVAIDTYQRSQ